MKKNAEFQSVLSIGDILDFEHDQHAPVYVKTPQGLMVSAKKISNVIVNDQCCVCIEVSNKPVRT